jgi:quinol monooxygenase YgiN
MAYVVSALWRAKEGCEGRVAEIVGELIAPSRAEPGSLLYQPHRSPEDPRLFYLYEQYVDEAAYQAHMDSEHFTRLVKQEAIPELLESRERAFYVTLGEDVSRGAPTAP